MNQHYSADTGYSISFFGQRVKTYIASGFFGLTTGFGLNLFCFIIIFITIGSLSWKYSINEPVLISLATLFMVWLFEWGLGLISISGNVTLTFWIGLITVALLIKEGLKLV